MLRRRRCAPVQANPRGLEPRARNRLQGFVDDSHADMVVQILANSLERDPHFYARPLQNCRRSHARQHQQLRRADYSGSQHHLTGYRDFAHALIRHVANTGNPLGGNVHDELMNGSAQHNVQVLPGALRAQQRQGRVLAQ